MKDLAGLVREAQRLQAEMARVESLLEQAEIEGQSGAGMVRVTLNGKGVARRVSIDPSLLKPEEQGVLEDLLLAAVNDAKAKADAHAQELMKSVSGGLAGMLPPGFKPPF
jgi:DNA-binding YbaB/EbfC family protein